MGIFAKYTEVTVNINARMQPADREEYFGKTLARGIKKRKLGKEVGGGTLLSDVYEPENCDVEIDCVKGKEEELYSLLREFPFPKGSAFIVHGGETLPLGFLDGMGIYLNGTDLPEEVYKNCDINEVVQELCSALTDGLFYFSHWRGPKETALYLYGKDYGKMQSAVQPFLQSYPLCEKCRVVRLTPENK